MYLAASRNRVPTLQVGWIVWGLRNGKTAYWNGYTMYEPTPWETGVPMTAVLFPSVTAANAVKTQMSIRAYNPQVQKVTVLR